MRGTVSVGRGSYPEGVCEELARNDLVQASRGHFAISEVGLQHLRRAASTSEEGFRGQHAEIVTGTIAEETGPAKVLLNAAESPLDWLRRRKDRDGEP
jgi:hypothetical protein